MLNYEIKWNHTAKALAACLMAALVLAPAAVADEVCEEFPKKRQIHRLGGSHAFAKSIETTDQLAAVFAVDKNRMAMAKILREKGLESIAPMVISKLEKGDVVEGPPTHAGQVFEWMVWRGARYINADKMCMVSSKSYSTFALQVSEEKVEETEMATTTTTHTYSFLIPKACVNLALASKETTVTEKKKEVVKPPVCELKVTRNCGSGTFTVDATGSSDGAKVTMGGGKNLGGLTWQGEDPAPNDEIIFITEAKNSRGETCRKEVTPERCPSCVIDIDPTEILAREDTDIGVTGYWKEPGGLQLTAKNGDSESTITPGTNSFSSPGTYEIHGTATNESGQTATCSSSLTVNPRMIVRLFGVNATPNDDKIMISTTQNGLPLRRGLRMGSGQGLGGEFEYLFNHRVGLAVGAQFADLDSNLVIDLGDDWGMANADISFLPLTVGLNFHLTPQKRADLYLGIFAALVNLGDGSYSAFGSTTNLDFDDEIGLGAQLGVDIPFKAGSPWGLNLAAQYIQVEADAGEFNLDLDPLLLHAGVAYRF